MARGHLEVALQTALPEGRVASKPWACCFVRRIPGASLDRGGSFWTSRCQRQVFSGIQFQKKVRRDSEVSCVSTSEWDVL